MVYRVVAAAAKLTGGGAIPVRAKPPISISHIGVSAAVSASMMGPAGVADESSSVPSGLRRFRDPPANHPSIRPWATSISFLEWVAAGLAATSPFPSLSL